MTVTLNQYEFLGAYAWNDQTIPTYAAPNIDTNNTFYKRMTMRDVVAGKLKAWLATKPKDAIIGLRIQELVQGETALPDNHGLPSVRDDGLNAIVINYNDPSWITYLTKILILVRDQCSGYRVSRIDFSFGNWGEGHFWGATSTLAYRPSDATLAQMISVYTSIFTPTIVYASVNPSALRLCYERGVRRAFFDSWGMIDNNGRDHLERQWNDIQRKSYLDQMLVVGETGSSKPSNLNFDWMLASVLRHENLVAFGNGNFPYSSLTTAQKAVINRILNVMNERRAKLLATSVPPTDVAALLDTIQRLEADVQTLKAERDAVQGQVAQLTKQLQEQESYYTNRLASYSQLYTDVKAKIDELSTMVNRQL